MTLQEALSMVDEMKTNLMKESTKIRFISEVEGMVHSQIIMKHEHEAEQETCPVYDDSTDPATVLLVPAPHAMLYVYYVMSKIDQMNQEEDKEYNNRVRFENIWDDYAAAYIREHMPLQPARYYNL